MRSDERAESGVTLEVKQASLWRGGRCLFSDLAFDLGNGSAATVVGPNGSGKTSLLRMLAGFIPPATGSVTVNRTPIATLVRDNRAPVHYHGHADGLKRDLTIRENLQFYAELWSSNADIEAALNRVSLSVFAERHVRFLSAGQRRRASLALLDICPAVIWLLDEPFANLDAAGITAVEAWLGAHLASGGMAVIATHQPIALRDIRQLRIELQ